MSDDSHKWIANLAKIKEILPHRPPFLFVDKILEFKDDQSIITEKYITAQEEFLKGHFPNQPIMPGVLISEALAQTCGVLVGLTIKQKKPNAEDMLPVLVLAHIDIKFQQTVLPESRLIMQAMIQKRFGGLYRFRVKASVNKEIVANGILSLAAVRA